MASYESYRLLSHSPRCSCCLPPLTVPAVLSLGPVPSEPKVPTLYQHPLGILPFQACSPEEWKGAVHTISILFAPPTPTPISSHFLSFHAEQLLPSSEAAASQYPGPGGSTPSELIKGFFPHQRLSLHQRHLNSYSASHIILPISLRVGRIIALIL